MQALLPYLIALHEQDLLEEARLARRAKLAQDASTSVPAWRRTVSGLLASAARTLDPSVEAERGAHREGSVGRVLAS